MALVDEMIIVLDTETTGLPARGANPEQTTLWPRLVSVAWSSVEKRQCTGLDTRTIKPDGFEIPESASNVHGITTAIALQEGILLKEVLDALCDAIQSATHLVCYNTRFDKGVLLAEALRTGHKRAASLFAEKAWYCLMNKVMRHLNLKRYIKLEKAYSMLCEKEAETASITFHRADDDVKATVAIFLALFANSKMLQ